MKIIIYGGRGFLDYEFVKYSCLKSKFEITEVVCGGARGADTLGKMFAEEFGIPVKMFLADWEGLGRKAGPIRNEQMGNYCDGGIGFPGKTGTKHMTAYLKKLGKPVEICEYKKAAGPSVMDFTF